MAHVCMCGVYVNMRYERRCGGCRLARCGGVGGGGRMPCAPRRTSEERVGSGGGVLLPCNYPSFALR
eukprot:1873455-Prymnesium_polylepis.1